MRRLITFIAAAALAIPAFSGTSYNFKAETSGARKSVMSGRVEVDGKNLRMDVTEGDGMLFKDGAVVYSTDGGKTMLVAMPADKTYYELKLDDMLGGGGTMLKAMGDMVKLSFDNQKVNVTDAGAGETIEGFPTKRSILDASYDMNVDAMGQKMSTHMSMRTESWTTDKISADSINFFQMRGLRTGIEGLDKLIDAQSAAMKGRFPLKQVTTMTINRGAQPMVTTTTATVSNVATKTIAAGEFAMPTGYTKVDNPIEKMMSGIKLPPRG